MTATSSKASSSISGSGISQWKQLWRAPARAPWWAVKGLRTGTYWLQNCIPTALRSDNVKHSMVEGKGGWGVTSATSLAGLYHGGHIVGSRFAPLEKLQNSSRAASKDGSWRNLKLTLYGEKNSRLLSPHFRSRTGLDNNSNTSKCGWLWKAPELAVWRPEMTLDVELVNGSTSDSSDLPASDFFLAAATATTSWRYGGGVFLLQWLSSWVAGRRCFTARWQVLLTLATTPCFDKASREVLQSPR